MINFSDVYNYVQSLNLTNSYNIIDYVDECDNIIDLDRNKTNGSIFYNSKSYIDKIYESFDNLEENIWRQVSCDISRTDVFYNNTRISTVEQLQSITTNLIVAMLTTQAAFYLPFYLLHNLFGDIDNNIYVMNDPMNRSVKITDDNITLECMFKLVDVTSNININYINIKLLYDLHDNNNIILWNLY